MSMKCDDALAAMLDADLADLHPEHPARLSLHLRDCARCRRVATQLREDSAQLAAMVAVSREATVRGSGARPPMRVLPWLAGAAAVAALALVMRPQSDPASIIGPTAPSQGPFAAIDVTVPAGTRRAAPPATPVVELTRRPSNPHGERRVEVPPFAPPAAVAAVTFDPPEAAAAVPFDTPSAVVAVPLHATPTQAMVASTAPRERTLPPPNPDVTVVRSPLSGVTALWFN
jgi:hypothetical protein